MAGNSAFVPIKEKGWQRGLDNLLRAGFAEWWKTSTWWMHALIWSAVLGLFLAGILFSGADVEPAEGLSFVSVFIGLFPIVAVIIILQGAIVGEKQNGTAAWVLSKPVSRTAYIVSKLVPNAVGMVTTMVVIPGLVAVTILSLTGLDFSPLGVVAGLAVLALNMLFYVTLTVMLGAIFDSRGGVIGIALGILFGQQYLIGLAPFMVNILPWSLVVPTGGEGAQSIASALMLGQTPETILPIFLILALVVVFVYVAIRSFKKQEL